MKKLSLFILLILCAFTFGCGKPLYGLSDDALVDYTGTTTNVVVPMSYDGTNIHRLGPNVYSYNIYIENVIIGSNIKRIETCAFWYCTELRTVAISNEIEEIAPFAFHQCYSITDVYYGGTEEQFKLLFEDEESMNSNKYLFEANIHYEYDINTLLND